jgi:hypothetical protein
MANRKKQRNECVSVLFEETGRVLQLQILRITVYNRNLFDRQEM